MPVWILFAVIAGVGMLGYNLCAKLGGGSLPPPVFAMTMYAAGFAGVLPIFLWYISKQPEGFISTLPLAPLLFSAGAGLVVIVVDLAISKMFNLGAEVGLGMTSIFLISIFSTAVIGFFVLKESYSLVNCVGLLFALLAIPMIFYGSK